MTDRKPLGWAIRAAREWFAESRAVAERSGIEAAVSAATDAEDKLARIMEHGSGLRALVEAVRGHIAELREWAEAAALVNHRDDADALCEAADTLEAALAEVEREDGGE